jgi:hypothetical protein
VDGCTAMSCFGVASALDGGRQSVVTYGILQDAKYTRMPHASRRHNVIFKSDDSSTYVA